MDPIPNGFGDIRFRVNVALDGSPSYIDDISLHDFHPTFLKSFVNVVSWIVSDWNVKSVILTLFRLGGGGEGGHNILTS